MAGLYDPGVGFHGGETVADGTAEADGEAEGEPDTVGAAAGVSDVDAEAVVEIAD